MDSVALHSELVFSDLLDCLVLDVTPSGVISNISSNSKRIVGYNISQLRGKNISLLLADDQKFKFNEHIESYLNPAISNSTLRGTEINVSHANEAIINCLLKVTNSLTNDNIICTLLDISELHDTRHRLLNSARLTAVGELASGIGHEINNPLASIAGYLNLMEKRLALLNVHDTKIDNYVSIINDATNRIETITSDLRVFTRKQPSDKKSFQINKLIDKTVSMLRPSLVAKGILTLIDVNQTDSYYLAGDAGRFQQILINIIANARDALKNSSTRKKITITTELKNKQLSIRIQDNGCGIPDEVIPKVFNSYFTTKNETEGTGIGLNLCKLIIEEFNGDITFNTKVGYGTSFYISTPCFNEENAAFQQSKGLGIDESVTASIKSLKGIKILVVEDEPQLAELITIFLTDLEASVFIAKNGIDALAKLSDLDFDIVITDFQMPLMNGLELIEIIKKDERLTAIKLILMTGGVSGNQLGKALALSDGYLYKPLDFDKMIREINSVLTNHAISA